MDDSFVGELMSGKGFLFDCEKYWVVTKLEDTACRYQREYRTKNGFHPITGERIS